jgi:hypothetical protein
MKNNKTESLATLELKSYTPLQLSRMYDVSKNTFLKWVKPFSQDLGERVGHYYSIKQVAIIIEKLGTPGKILKRRVVKINESLSGSMKV